MTLIDKLLRREPKDPYWHRFMNGPLSDPLNDATEAYRTAHPGKVFPAKSEVPEPARMAHDLAQFAVFMGASGFGAAATDAATLRPREGETDGAGTLAEDFPFTLVISVPAEADPDRSPGVGGQQPRRISALVNHAVASYIRELGYNAIVCPIDTSMVAASAGLQRPAKSWLGDGVLTDLSVGLGVQEV